MFDIDGTLTPHPLSIFDVRADAANAVRIFAGKGYTIIYLSARPRLLQPGLPHWLREHDFPDGILRVAQTREEEEKAIYHPATFKKQILEDLKHYGCEIKYAFGDSGTDFTAYTLSGIPPASVFALLPEKEPPACQPGDKWRCGTAAAWQKRKLSECERVDGKHCDAAMWQKRKPPEDQPRGWCQCWQNWTDNLDSLKGLVSAVPPNCKSP